MEGGQTTFYSSPDRSVVALYSLAAERPNHLVTVLRFELTRTTSLAHQLPALLNEVLSLGLEQARGEEQTGIQVLDTQVDLSQVPEKLTVSNIIDISNLSQKQEEAYKERLFLQTATKLNEVVDGLESSANERYRLDSEPFYSNENSVVRLFKGVTSTELPIVIKRHTFPKTLEQLNKQINAGIVQARVQHAHVCRILAMHLEVRDPQRQYYLDHILEALERDVEMEIQNRVSSQRPFVEWDLWSFLAQTASALASAHTKVTDM